MQKYSKNRLIAGTHFIQLKQVDSTNNYMSELVQREKLPEGTVTVASEQLQGRGQMGSGWTSEAGKNLTFSMVIYPQYMLAHEQFVLSMAVSLAIYDTLRRQMADCCIKWPNDIYISHKKIAGILVENILSGGQIRQSIIGIGLNVNQQYFPKHVPNPTSICLETGGMQPVDEVLEQLLDNLDARLLQMKAGKVNGLREQYTACLYRYRKPYLYEVDGEVHEGIITGVDASGRLKVEMDGAERLFALKEIKYLYELWN